MTWGYEMWRGYDDDRQQYHHINPAVVVVVVVVVVEEEDEVVVVVVVGSIIKVFFVSWKSFGYHYPYSSSSYYLISLQCLREHRHLFLCLLNHSGLFF